MTRLIVMGDKAYLVDLPAFKKSLFEPMPMTTLPPEPGFRVYMDLAPKIMVPQTSFVIVNSFGPDPVWEFKYLFPLGKRGFVKRGHR